jgi:hypothetical protein
MQLFRRAAQQSLDAGENGGERIDDRVGDPLSLFPSDRTDVDLDLFRFGQEFAVLPLVQIGLRRHAHLPDLPLLTELAQNEADRELLHFISADVGIARAAWIPTPPGILRTSICGWPGMQRAI